MAPFAGFLAPFLRSLGLGRYGAVALRRASIRSATFSQRQRSFGVSGGVLLVDEVDQNCLVLIFELVGLEVAGFLIHDMLGNIRHILDFYVMDLVEIFGRISG
ncbi:hypothetical protein [Bradyrhizobium sp. SZCCHNS3051]|uniref:hypothetical protein n=1 Tax=Bradyrhizobium sp. SZCCHNS3051 TaxID=3057320 RepID=UPI0029164508|nr:hypothetical protein [Bradyrhizobium sp. SZCCHNS3051]